MIVIDGLDEAVGALGATTTATLVWALCAALVIYMFVVLFLLFLSSSFSFLIHMYTQQPCLSHAAASCWRDTSIVITLLRWTASTTLHVDGTGCESPTAHRHAFNCSQKTGLLFSLSGVV